LNELNQDEVEEMKSNKLSKSKLQNALDGLANAHDRVRKWRTIIHEHCIEVYGQDPADVDNDDFIDSCDGGCGYCRGMTVENFEKSMEQAIEQAGIETMTISTGSIPTPIIN